MADYFRGPLTGPMAQFVDGYQAALDEHGYAATTSQQLVSLLGRLSRWLDAQGLGPRDLSDTVMQRFLDGLALEVTWIRRPTLATFGLLLGYLRGLGAVSKPPPETVSPEGIIRNRFERYLLHERGLSPDTVGG
jgi:integrase/recombinase XerD